MHLDVIPSLRCPRPHEDAALVLVADETRGRHVVTGILGCPMCEAEFAIRARVAYFAGPGPVTAAAAAPEIIRTAAMLGLSEPGGVLMLAGQWAVAAETIGDIADALVLVVNPPAYGEYGERASVIHVGDRLPIAARALRAAALDVPIPGVVSTLRPKGRLVATNAVPVPPGIDEIARDAEYWVGESSGFGPALALRRGLTLEGPMRERDEPDVHKKGMNDPKQDREGERSGQPGWKPDSGTKPSSPPGKTGGMKDESDLDDR